MSCRLGDMHECKRKAVWQRWLKQRSGGADKDMKADREDVGAAPEPETCPSILEPTQSAPLGVGPPLQSQHTHCRYFSRAAATEVLVIAMLIVLGLISHLLTLSAPEYNNNLKPRSQWIPLEISQVPFDISHTHTNTHTKIWCLYLHINCYSTYIANPL